MSLATTGSAVGAPAPRDAYLDASSRVSHGSTGGLRRDAEGVMSGLGEILFFAFEIPVLLVSIAACALIVVLGRRIPRLAGRAADIGATQAMHSRLTPRVGGVGIMTAAIAAFFFMPTFPATDALVVFSAAVLLFGVALLEDLGYHVSPAIRLRTAMVSSVIVIAGFGAWIPGADLPALDPVIGSWLIGIPLTITVVAALSNGFNLIDGVNGLSSFTAMVALLALAVIADHAGADAMAVAGVLLATAILGFFVLNYPFGLIFLGDAGAYTIGFLVSWFGIYLMNVNPDVSAWAVLLAVFWPAADTIFAIYRRVSRKRSMMQPDRLHPHQVVLRCLEVCVLGRERRDLANPLTTAALAPFIAAPPIVAVLVWDKPALAFAFILLFATLFVMSISVLTGFIRGRSFARTRAAVTAALPVARAPARARPAAVRVAVTPKQVTTQVTVRPTSYESLSRGYREPAE